MSFDSDKLDYLMSAFSQSEPILCHLSYDELQILLHSTIVEIREWLAKALVNDSPSNNALSMLCELAIDKEASVRIEAIDSLSAFQHRDSFIVLCDALKDDDALVRAYAAYGIGFVGNVISPIEAIHILQKAEKYEKNAHVLVGIYEGLYLLGDEDILVKLFGLFDSNNYHVQCAVLHALMEIISEQNSDEIREFVSRMNESLFPKSVQELMRQTRLLVK